MLMKDELFNAQLLRAMGFAAYGGADIGECLATAERITRVDPVLWYREWSATASRLREAAFHSLRGGQRASARRGFFQASNYFRTAGIFFMGAPVDRRLRESHRQEVECFRRGAALLDVPPDIIDIPYAATTLPAYFFVAAADGAPRPTMILTTGYDGTVEELYFSNGAAALERGYNVLAFEGPGQGGVIIDRGMPFRPDWENVVTPVVNYALSRPEVDASNIALLGLSFGGYLAPRAVTAEHRISACISDCGNADLLQRVSPGSHRFWRVNCRTAIRSCWHSSTQYSGRSCANQRLAGRCVATCSCTVCADHSIFSAWHPSTRSKAVNT
jgi:hypothetical protein